jgi:GAF domain-containing protein
MHRRLVPFDAPSSVDTRLLDPGETGPPRPTLIPPDTPDEPETPDEGVALVTAACQGRRRGYSGLTAAVGHICRSAGFEVGHVYTCSAGTDQILPSRIWYLAPPASRFAPFVRSTSLSPLVPGQGLPGRVVCTGGAIVIDPLSDDVHMPRAHAAVASGLRSACGYPVVANQELVVVLEFLTSRSIRSSGAPDALVAQLAAVLAPHLRNLEPEELL